MSDKDGVYLVGADGAEERVCSVEAMARATAREDRIWTEAVTLERERCAKIALDRTCNAIELAAAGEEIAARIRSGE